MSTPRPKKIIAHVHAYAGHGRDAGAETTLANLLESLVKNGWEAEVILADHGQWVDPYVHNGVPVRTSTRGSDLIDLLPEADVLITHLECSDRVSYIRQIHKIPTVQLVHNTMWQTEGYLNEGCDLAVFNTEWVREYHEQHATMKNPVGYIDASKQDTHIDFRVRRPRQWKSIVLHPQVYPGFYNDPPRKPRTHVTLVNLFESKGAETFWELSRRFPDQPFMAIKGGYGEQVIPEVIPENVSIIDNTPDMAWVYGQSKVLLMPSKYESFGRVAIEGGSQGVPTIATGTPGLREALGRDGLYVEDWQDVDAWEKELQILLTDRVRYEDASFNALQRSNYWHDQVQPETERFVEAIETLTSPKKGW